MLVVLADGFGNQTGDATIPCKGTKLNNAAASYVDDPEVIFLRKRLFDDLTRTRTLDCDDQDVGSDASSYDSDCVALSVIVDQDLGLVGGTVPPNISPPPIPGLKNEDIDRSSYKDFSINKADAWCNTTIQGGDPIYIGIANMNLKNIIF